MWIVLHSRDILRLCRLTLVKQHDKLLFSENYEIAKKSLLHSSGCKGVFCQFSIQAQTTSPGKAVSFDGSLSTSKRWNVYKIHIKNVNISYLNVLPAIHINFHLRGSQASNPPNILLNTKMNFLVFQKSWGYRRGTSLLSLC